VSAVLRAIETEWRGYRFRSRIEARWAVLFESLGWPWEYEPEGFDLGDGFGRYLPDFRVRPGCGPEHWFEIKGAPPTEREQRLATELYWQTRTPVAILYGGIEPRWLSRVSRHVFRAYVPMYGCTIAQLLGFYLYRGHEIEPPETLDASWYSFPDIGPGVSVRAAAAAARAARFEHGDQPIVPARYASP